MTSPGSPNLSRTSPGRAPLTTSPAPSKAGEEERSNFDRDDRTSAGRGGVPSVSPIVAVTLSDHDDGRSARGCLAPGLVSPHSSPASGSLHWQTVLDLPGPPPLAQPDTNRPGLWIVRTVFLSRGDELCGWDDKPRAFKRAQRIWLRTRRVDSDALDSDMFPANRITPPPPGVRMLQRDHDDVRDFLRALKGQP